MILTEEQRAANRAAFRAMSVPAKADYILSYYKLPLVIALIVAVAVGSVAHRALTHRDAVLYLAFANVVPPAEVEGRLTEGYVEATARDPRTSEVSCYHELYLDDDPSSANHQYAYASRIKLMAAAENRELDVVLMNRTAWDLLSSAGYLMDLGEAFGADDALRTNSVTLESNQVEVDLNEADELVLTTTEAANALEVTDAALFAGFSGAEPLYLGVLANTPRPDEALAFLSYVEGS